MSKIISIVTILLVVIDTAIAKIFWGLANGPTAPQNIRVFAVNSLGYVFADTNEGIYRSTDNESQKFLVKTKRPFRLPRTLEIFLSMIVVLELIAPFTPKSYGLDGGAHLNWIREFSDLFLDGVYIPRWAPTAFGGFGSATFYFYPPLTFYIASIIRFFGGIASPNVLFQLTGLVGTIASFITCRALLRSLSKEKYQTTVGALLYAFGPLRIFDLYNRCSLSTHIAYVSFPLVWLGLITIQRSSISDHYRSRQLIRSILLLAISSALLALTSVPLTIVTIISAIVAAIICRRWIGVRGILATSIGGVLALGLTSFHFSASLAASSYIWLNEIEVQYTSANLDTLLHNVRSPEVYNLVLIYIAYVFVDIGLWNSFRNGRSRSSLSIDQSLEIVAAKIGIVLLLLYIVLDSHYSLPLWGHFQPLRLIQFASRFWSQLILGVAITVGLAHTPAMQRVARDVVWVWVLGCIVPAMLVTFNLHLNAHSDPTVNDALEYRPIYTLPRARFIESIGQHAADPLCISEFSPGEFVRLLNRGPVSLRFEANLQKPHLVIFRQFFWPDWHLYVDGKEQPARPDSIGRAIAALPQGVSTLQWQWEQGQLECAGIWISCSTILLLVIMWGIISWQGRPEKIRIM